ncbi:hypothetical protein C8Q70DRAFT_211807 [Cubamyces menziesii]|nr:hypothetical protein C8Q70DRAFT_211807 [Cubamyces menziesii]
MRGNGESKPRREKLLDPASQRVLGRLEDRRREEVYGGERQGHRGTEGMGSGRHLGGALTWGMGPARGACTDEPTGSVRSGDEAYAWQRWAQGTGTRSPQIDARETLGGGRSGSFYGQERRGTCRTAQKASEWRLGRAPERTQHATPIDACADERTMCMYGKGGPATGRHIYGRIRQEPRSGGAEERRSSEAGQTGRVLLVSFGDRRRMLRGWCVCMAQVSARRTDDVSSNATRGRRYARPLQVKA